MSKFELFVIEGCPFCNKSLKLMKDSKIKHKVVVVPPEKKAFYKKAHQMNTFPQVFYHKKNGSIIKVGDSNDLQNLVQIIKNMTVIR